MADQPRPSWAMGGITSPAVEEYLYSILPASDAVLREMEAEAARRAVPIVGPLVGRALFLLASMIGAKAVFELGSAIGYSTIWWARAVGEDGRVTYTDGSAALAQEARRNFDRAGVGGRVQVLVGDALELLSEQRQGFDIIFVDIDKEDYPRVLRLAVPRLRKGGLLVADNALWSGKVAGPNPDLETRGIMEFNRQLYASRDLVSAIFPMRDGLAVAMKV